MPHLFRDRSEAHSGRVSFVELFFDLVFVFAITQLSHHLLSHLTFEGLWQTGFLLLAVWWVWIYTAWVTNWMNPEAAPVRLMLFVLMGLGLLLTTALPKAFTDPLQGLIFAGAYVAMQVGRSAYMAWHLKSHSHDNHINFVRISIWLILSGLFWIAGGLNEGTTRVWLWVIALTIEFISPRAFFWVPGLGRSHFSTWDIDGEHFAERCGLFIIIALGESIIVMGDTFSHHPMSPIGVVSFITCFAASLGMYWLYFGLNAHKASHAIAHSALPGRLAQIAYTYVHILLVAGIIVTAVGFELLLSHPDHAAPPAAILSLVGGPVLYLLGNLLFILVTSGKTAFMHLIGIAGLGGLGALLISQPETIHIDALMLGGIAGAAMILISLIEPRAVLKSHKGG